MKNPIGRCLGLMPSEQGIIMSLRLAPSVTKEQIETWMGEEGALVGLVHAPEHIQLKSQQPQKPKGGPKAKWLGQVCKDPNFHQFMYEAGYIGGIDGNKQMAETNVIKAVRAICGVKSRAEIDSNETASKVFTSKIQHPYAHFMKKRGK